MSGGNIAYFDLTMLCRCPKCHHEIDLEDLDSETWLPLFKAWVSSKPKADQISQKIECDLCDHEFTLNHIKR